MRRTDVRGDAFWALHEISFEVPAGETVAIIGRNGAGKSTLLKILSRITEPTGGSAEIHGRIGSLLEVGTGFHWELSGRENIFLNGAILGMRRHEIRRRFDEIVDFAGIERFIDTAVKHYSSGMYLRLAFAVAAHLETEVLLVDEVLAVGDVQFQQKCLGKMNDVSREGRTVLFVSHNMGALRSLCRSGIVLDAGRIAHQGSIEAAIEAYQRQIGALGGPDRDRDPMTEGTFGPLRASGIDGGLPAQDEPIRLATTLRVDEPVAGFTLFCILDGDDGRRVLHLREESPALGLRDVPIGRYAIQLMLPPLWLNPGLYSVHFKVLFWGDRESSRHLSDKYPLDITGVGSVSSALLHPRASWEVQADTPAARAVGPLAG